MLSCGAACPAALLLVNIVYGVTRCMCQLCTYAWTYTLIYLGYHPPTFFTPHIRPYAIELNTLSALHMVANLCQYKCTDDCCRINCIRTASMVYVSDMPMHSYSTPLYCLMHALRIYQISYLTHIRILVRVPVQV